MLPSKCICEDGYSGATMAKVAKKAELPVGSVYWHFENKDLLLAALIETSFERWHNDVLSHHRPLPGEAFEQHVKRILAISETGKPYDAADFWRLGVILSVEKSVREQVARERFLKIRQMQLAELSSWWRTTLPAACSSTIPACRSASVALPWRCRMATRLPARRANRMKHSARCWPQV